MESIEIESMLEKIIKIVLLIIIISPIVGLDENAIALTPAVGTISGSVVSNQPVQAPTPSPISTPIPASGIFYVAKNGNDNNPGTEVEPWLTIKKAANTLVAGETVYVRAGTYKEQVTVKNSGNAEKYITGLGLFKQYNN